MNDMQRAAVLTELADQLRKQGSWCGETHLQKATYFLQTLLEVPLGLEFVFYKHGPYSFDLTGELTALRAYGLLELRAQPAPYGPSLLTTERSLGFRQRYPVTLRKHGCAVAFVAQALGNKKVSELERLATALYVTREGVAGSSVQKRAERLHELKPHVSVDLALQAVREADQLAHQLPKADEE